MPETMFTLYTLLAYVPLPPQCAGLFTFMPTNISYCAVGRILSQWVRLGSKLHQLLEGEPGVNNTVVFCICVTLEAFSECVFMACDPA